MLFRRRSVADAGPVGRRSPGSCAAPTFELVPLKNALDQADFLPAGATVSVTASPAKGIEATVALCEQLQARGFRAVPHLSARMIRDRGHLAELIAWLEGAGVDRAFVVGGDAKEPGDYPDGLSLLRAMAEIGHPLERDRDPGLPAGPRLHRRRAAARGAARQGGLRQLHDDAALLRPERDRVLAGRPTRRGHHAAGPPRRCRASPSRSELLAISARIGVADTHRFLVKNTRFIARLIRSGGFYRPDGLLEGLAPHVAEPANGIVDLHLYTFNAVDVTERWRTAYLEQLRVKSAA